MNSILERLPILVLYPHSRCNCRCVMCDIWKVDTIQEISAEELERHAADIERLGVEWVVFSGGEPLMHSDLFRLCKILRVRRVRTTILSTGLLLERYAARIIANVDDVIISLDGPPEVHDQVRRVSRAFELLAGGVRAIHALQPGFPIAARCTVQRSNCSRLCETVRTARDLGLSSISFLAADVSSTAFNRPDGWASDRQAGVALSREELDLLEVEIDTLIADPANEGFVLETPEKLRRIVRHFRAHLGLEEPGAPRCNAPWVSAVVEADGTVRPCFFHAPIGHLGPQTLAQAINSPQAVAFRQDLDVATNPTCRRCVCSLYRSESLPP